MWYVRVVAQRGATLFKVLTHDVNLFIPNSCTLPNYSIRECPLLSRWMFYSSDSSRAFLNVCNHKIFAILGSKWIKTPENFGIRHSSFSYLVKIVRWQKFHQQICRVKRRGKKEYKERGMFLYSPLTHQPNTTPITNTVDTRFTSILTQTIAPSIIPLTTFNIYSALQDMIDSFIWRSVQHLLRTTDLFWKFHKGNNRGSTPSSHHSSQSGHSDGGLFPWTRIYE
jgi:hypothetical protein